MAKVFRAIGTVAGVVASVAAVAGNPALAGIAAAVTPVSSRTGLLTPKP